MARGISKMETALGFLFLGKDSEFKTDDLKALVETSIINSSVFRF